MPRTVSPLRRTYRERHIQMWDASIHNYKYKLTCFRAVIKHTLAWTSGNSCGSGACTWSVHAHHVTIIGMHNYCECYIHTMSHAHNMHTMWLSHAQNVNVNLHTMWLSQAHNVNVNMHTMWQSHAHNVNVNMHTMWQSHAHSSLPTVLWSCCSNH